MRCDCAARAHRPPPRRARSASGCERLCTEVGSDSRDTVGPRYARRRRSRQSFALDTESAGIAYMPPAPAATRRPGADTRCRQLKFANRGKYKQLCIPERLSRSSSACGRTKGRFGRVRNLAYNERSDDDKKNCTDYLPAVIEVPFDTARPRAGSDTDDGETADGRPAGAARRGPDVTAYKSTETTSSEI
ncbi:hypothetical protein EVAR_46315_1 [Eumeta japonica]|uniref:Uncharacterized protein n=1 Tax=Eumeta variegata TaxID=151549 RepID=A0A4C1Y009_EUMVA|nr:hypothetical protein EVAR_46315_1 [Eumeta japonica]